MSGETGTQMKVCCKCGMSLSGQKRFKDSQGRYWCVACGQLDERKKRLAAGGICAGCGESFSPGQMTEFGSLSYCKKCITKRYKNAGQSGVLASVSGVFSKLFRKS